MYLLELFKTYTLECHRLDLLDVLREEDDRDHFAVTIK